MLGEIYDSGTLDHMKDDEQPDNSKIEYSAVMQKVLSDLSKVEIVLSMDEAEAKAKRIDAHITLHLKDSATTEH